MPADEPIGPDSGTRREPRLRSRDRDAVAGEFDCKHQRLAALMNREGFDALVLADQANFSWLSCGGRGFVPVASVEAVAAFVVTRHKVTLVTNNIEMGRLAAEELPAVDLDEESFPWHAADKARDDIIARVAGSGKVGWDLPGAGRICVGDMIARLRWALVPEEIERYRETGALAEEALRAAAMAARPGWTEHRIAAGVAEQVQKRGMEPIVILIACDDRTRTWRHPLPTENRLRDIAMLVLCARKGGLIASLTRLVKFSPVDGELARKHKAVCEVDAALITASKVGRSFGSVFQEGVACYKNTGFPDEWQLHHQGGPTGYAPREFLATAHVDEPIVANQAIAWNPSIAGTKSEDTIIVGDDGFEIITAPKQWPTVTVEAGGVAVERADILVP